MNVCVFEGKIYNLKSVGKGDKARITFRLGVRKDFLTEADKEAKRYNNFVSLTAFGKTAEFIENNFEDGKNIGVTCSYETWEGKDDDGDKTYNHNFKVNSASFVGAKEDSDDSGSKKSSTKSNTKTTTTKRKPDPEPEDDGDGDGDDDGLPF